MPEKMKFDKHDIGGEILPILTSGLYRNKLDALREYVQNAIDAKAKKIEIVIDPDTIMVDDSGVGMSFEQAKNAIKLGISEKNPRDSVGFRGIGIYSAYNLCDRLDIYTKSEKENRCIVIHFDFGSARLALHEDQERKKNDLPTTVYLEKLLED
ncbi:ATP-binding protein, partial [Chloroflexota bacterium]